MIKQLLQGAASAQSAGLNLGQQIEQIASGLDVIKKAGINDADVDMVAGSIIRLSSALNTFGVNNKKREAGVVQAVRLLNELGSIPADVIENIIRLRRIGSDLEFVSELVSTLGSFKGLTLPTPRAMRNIIDAFNTLGDINVEQVLALEHLNGLDIKSFNNLSQVINAISTAKVSDKTVADIRRSAEILRVLGSVSYDTIENINNLTMLGSKGLEHLSEVIPLLQFRGLTRRQLEASQLFVQTLASLGSIDDRTIDNLNALEDIDTKAIQNVVNVLSSLDFSKLKNISGPGAKKNIEALSQFLSAVNSIMGEQSKNLSGMFSAWRAKRIGRTIGKFYSALLDEALKDRKNVIMKVEGLGQMIQAIMPLISSDSPVSIIRMKAVLTAENGAQIGAFFGNLLNSIPKKKDIDKVMKSLTEFLKMITSFALKDYIKFRLLLTEKNGERIGKFFSSIFNELQQENYPDLKPITDFLKNLSSIGITGALGLLALKGVITEKFGNSISGFINAVIKDMTREKLNAIKTFSNSVNLLSKSILILTGAIGLLTAEILFFGPLAVASSLALITLFVGTSILMMRMAGKAERDIQKGTAAFKDIAKAMTFLTLDVMLLAGAAVIL